MSIFEVGTIMAWVAPSFQVLLAGRLVQAVGVGITMPLMQTIMLSIFPANNRGSAMGMAGIVIGLAPALGPTLSGWVIDNFTWRDLFGMIVPIVAVVIILSFFFMRNVIKTTNPKLDILSLLLSTAGFGSLLYGFSSVGTDGWTSVTVLSTIIIGVVLILFFGYRQLHVKNPFLEIRVFKSKEFTIATILSSAVMVAMVGAEMILPLYLQNVHGMSAFHSGLALLPGALMMGVMSPITGNLFDRYGAKRLALTGMILLTVATIPFIFITRNTPTIYITMFYAVRLFGISMVMMPTTTAAMNSLSMDMISHGTAVNNTTRQIASSMGTAVLVSVLSNVTTNNMPAKSLLKATPFDYKIKAVDAVMNGYSAAFIIAVAFSVIGLIVAFFLSSNKNRVKVTLEAKGDTK